MTPECAQSVSRGQIIWKSVYLVKNWQKNIKVMTKIGFLGLLTLFLWVFENIGQTWLNMKILGRKKYFWSIFFMFKMTQKTIFHRFLVLKRPKMIILDHFLTLFGLIFHVFWPFLASKTLIFSMFSKDRKKHCSRKFSYLTSKL